MTPLRLLLATWCIAGPVAAMDVQLQVGSVQLAGVAEPIRNLRLATQLDVRDDALRLRDTQLRADWKPLGHVRAQLRGEARSSKHWTLRLQRLSTSAGHLQGQAARHDTDLSLRGTSTGLDLSALMPALSALGIAVPKLSGQFSGEFAAQRRARTWLLNTALRVQALTASDSRGRYASENLDVTAKLQAQRTSTRWQGQLSLDAPRGQAYVEPVFVDFSTASARGSTGFEFSTDDSRLRLRGFELSQHGVGQVNGDISMRPAEGRTSLQAAVQWQAVELAPAFTTYAQPFLVGTSLEKLAPAGQSSGRLRLINGAPVELQVQLQHADIALADTGLSGIAAVLHWAANAPVEESQLRWSGGRIADLRLGGGDAAFRAQASDFSLTRSLRLPLAGGALRVDQLALQNLGRPNLAAQFEAEIEPIDLAALCRAFGWPEFSGQLGGRLPGLHLRDNRLELDGALSARVFDGTVSVENLRVLDPLGRLPRVSADLHMRRLDLAALTGAFSFGRIEGRLDADVEELRLLDWQPVAFKAHLVTTPGDDSRQRISQRAIDNLSALGGGPSGVLSRGALRFFDDFAYARIGWRCVLANGVCHMDGLEPAANGGYVLVKGRWLPRIDVVGYTRAVDWNTFLSQLKSARASDGVQLR